jgi:hypothetical protein
MTLPSTQRVLLLQKFGGPDGFVVVERPMPVPGSGEVLVKVLAASVQFTDVMYYLNSNFLMLRTYYALKDTEALLSLIETFRIFVMRNKKMSPTQRKEYTNFLRFSKKLVELKHHGGMYTRAVLAEKLKALRAKIESTDSVINRSWLLEEAN